MKEKTETGIQSRITTRQIGQTTGKNKLTCVWKEYFISLQIYDDN